MGKVVEEAVAAGALGVSISRVIIHRDTKGRLTPGSLASSNELLALAEGVVKGGGGVFEMASSWDCYDDVAEKDPRKLEEYQRNEWKWMTKVATMNPEKLLFTTGMGTGMTKRSAYDHRGFIRMMEQIRSQGGSIMGTPMMRMGTLTLNLGNNWHPFIMSKTWRELKKQAGDSTDVLAAGMRENRAKIIEETEAKVKSGSRGIHHYYTVAATPHFVFPWSEDPEPSREESLYGRMKRDGTSYLDQTFDVLSQPDAAHGGNLMKILYSYGSHDLEPLCEMLKHDQVVPGFADGGAHMVGQCEGTTVTTMLTHYVRDRTRGPRLPIEMVVRKQTSDTAKMMGLHDRGELRPGMKADINVIDFDKLRVLPPQFLNDMPLGAGRIYQKVEGYRMTLVSGEVVLENDKVTGVCPGKLVRNPKSIGLQGSLKGSVPPSQSVDDINLVDFSERALEMSQGGGASAHNRLAASSKL